MPPHRRLRQGKDLRGTAGSTDPFKLRSPDDTFERAIV